MSKTAWIAEGALTPAGEHAQGPAAFTGLLAALLRNDLVILGLLIAINLACFSRTLGGYFLADDYVHVPYLVNVFAGHPELLAENFFSNWMQTQGTQFYRPFVSLTLAFDYAIAGANPLIYHVSNTLTQTAASMFLFLTVRRIFKGYGSGDATLAALFAGALFAANPLHPEVVSWVIGRVDSVCTAFYLLSFWLFLKGIQDGSRKSFAFALAAFAISLLSKEMAVTLPPALLLYCLIAPESQPWKSRALDALHKTWPFWALTAVYLVVRTLALGTVSGGYTGSIGEGLSASIFNRWFGDNSLLRVLFPFNAEVFPPNDRVRKLLRTLYTFAALSVMVRLALGPARAGFTRFVLFALGWLVVAVLPTYQVWNLSDTLQGSRFIYLGTAPLCLLAVCLFYPFARPGTPAAQPSRILMRLLSMAILTSLVALFAVITYRNNIPWAHASNQVRALRQAIEEKLSTMEAGKKLVLLNLPQRTQGAHMLYNAAMLDVLLRPPLSKENLASRVVTFEPMTYGDSDLIVISRLRRLAAQPDKYEFFAWNPDRLHLSDLSLHPSEEEISFAASGGGGALPITSAHRNAPLTIDEPGEGTYVESPAIDVPSTAIDFVDIELSSRRLMGGAQAPAFLILSWDTDMTRAFSLARRMAQPLTPDGKKRTYRFVVSEHKNWLTAERIHKLKLDLPAGPYHHELHAVRLTGGSEEIPQLLLDPSAMVEDDIGVTRMLANTCALAFDARRIPGANKVQVEVSKPNSWFDHYTGSLRDTSPSKNALRQFRLDSLRGTLAIPARDFPQAGYYQVRIEALGGDGQMVGYVSDPINLQIASQQIEESARHARQPSRGD